MYSLTEMAERKTFTIQYPYPLPLKTRQFSLNPTRVEIHRQRNLCRVERRNGIYRGYRIDILKENLTDRDEMFLICGICEGIMREACLTSSGEQFCSCCEFHGLSKQEIEFGITSTDVMPNKRILRKQELYHEISCYK